IALGLGADILLLAGAQVSADDAAALALRKVDLGTIEVIGHVEAVASGDQRPVVVIDRAGAGSARTGPTAVILQTAREVVEGFAIIRVDLVILPDGDIADELPGFATVVRDRNAAVLPLPDAAGILGVYPHRVIVAVGAGGDEPPGAPAIDRRGKPHGDGVEAILIGGVDRHVAVVQTAPHHGRVLRHHAEVFAAVVGAVERPLVGFADHIDHVGIARRHPDSHASPV